MNENQKHIVAIREALHRARTRLTGFGDNNCSFIQDVIKQHLNPLDMEFAMENDRQVKAVAEAIYRYAKANQGHNPQIVLEPLERWYGHAQAAIDASDAKYVPMLVEALKFYANHIHWMALADEADSLRRLLTAMRGDGVQHGWLEAEKALSQLPEDLR